MRTANKMPRARPGKNPTRTARTGNFWHWAPLDLTEHLQGLAALPRALEVEVGLLEAEMLELVVVVEGLPFGVEDGVEAIVEVAEAEAGGDDMMHWLLLQLKPNGQHWLPQDGSVPSNCVVKSSLWGLVAAFCLERSQLSGDMVEQSRPVGQHIAELLSLKATHCVSDGQQKLPGRPEWLQAVVFDCAQVSSALSRRPIACAACTAAERAVVEETVVDIRHTAVSLRNVIRPMIIIDS